MISTLQRSLPSSLLMVVACLSFCSRIVVADETPASSEKVSYYKQIRPIFQARCQGCHQPAKPRGKYVMTDFARMVAGGVSKEKAVVPGKPDESFLIDLITPEDGKSEMPKDGTPLTGPQLKLVTQWIAEGAVDDTPVNAKERYDLDHPPTYAVPPVLTALDYSPDGSMLAVAGFHEVLLHKADGSGLIARLVGLSARIESIRFSPDGKFLAVTGGLPSRMGEVQVWDVAKRTLKLSVPVTFDTVYGANWSPDGKLISFGCSDSSVRAMNSETGELVFFQGAHNGWVLDTVFSAKGDHLISVSRDMTAKLSVVATQRFIDNVTSITPGALKGGITSIERHPMRDEILVGGSDGKPKLFRVFRTTKRVIGDNANLIREFPALNGRVFDVAISHDGKRIAAGSSLDGTGQVRVFAYDFDTNLPADIKAIMVKRSQQRTPAERKKVSEFRKEGVKLLAEADIDSTGIYSLEFSPDGKTIAAGGADGIVRFLNSETGKITSTLVPVPIEKKVAQVSEQGSGEKADNEPPPAPKLPAGASLVSIEVQPTAIAFNKPLDTNQILVIGTLSTGDSVDLTRNVLVSQSELVEVSATGLVRPKKNGLGRIDISLNDKKLSVPVAVAMSTQNKISYVRDLAPVISKMGCNAGTCHGAKAGKNGFKLSLRGYDPIYDTRAFTDDLESRRINLASPENSLMLLKSTAGVPHTGGQLTKPGEAYYETIRQWIAQGAKLDQAPEVTAITLFPENPVVQEIGTPQQVRVIATYSDGEVRDVTSESFINSSNGDIAKSDKNGLVSTLRRGEAAILARYEGKYAATTLTVMGNRDGFAWQQPPANNFIDELVADKLERMKIIQSGLCTDAEFIRRIHLDLTGLPPTAEMVRKFLSDTRPTRVKRDAMIDSLIGSKEYIEHWANKWADLLQVNSKFLGREGATAFRKWIRDRIEANTPYDEFARQILTASGSNKENPAASYFKILRNPVDTMENTTHLFLAVRFNCNKCHDHPFERWTQDQYYETAAFFARVNLKPDPASGKKKIGGTAVEGAKPLYEFVTDVKAGDVVHDRTGAVTPPAFPYEAQFATRKEATRREQLASWMTSPDNQYFAPSYVNRIWGYMLGTGIIEPLDDIRAGNPPSNPELLNRLTQQFIDSGFDVQAMVRLVCKSRTYQLSIKTNKWNEDDTVNYSHAIARRLPAEVLYDSLHLVTGSALKIPGVAAGTRAAALPDAGIKVPSGFLDDLGRPPRESACECERTNSLQLGPVMALVSGPTVGNAISDPANVIPKLVSDLKDNRKLIDELFVRILNRPATDAEIAASEQILNSIPAEHKQLAADLTAYQKALVPIRAQREKDRVAAIAKGEKDLAAYNKKIAPREAELDRQQNERTAKLEVALQAYVSKLPEHQAAWETRQKETVLWQVLDPSQLTTTNGAKLEKQTDKSVLATGKNGKGIYKFVASTDMQNITGVRLELLTDDRLPSKGPGRADNGNFVLTEFKMSAAAKKTAKEIKKVVLQNAQADFSQAVYDVKTAIDNKFGGVNNGWASAPKLGQNRTAVFETKANVVGDGGVILTFELDHRFVDNKHMVGKFRISVTNSARPVKLQAISDEIRAILAIALDKRTDEQRKKVTDQFKTSSPEYLKLSKAVAESKKPRPIDPLLKKHQEDLEYAKLPLKVDPRLKQLLNDVKLSEGQLKNARLTGAQDIAWALINSPAFLFNR